MILQSLVKTSEKKEKISKEDERIGDNVFSTKIDKQTKTEKETTKHWEPTKEYQFLSCDFYLSSSTNHRNGEL